MPETSVFRINPVPSRMTCPHVRLKLANTSWNCMAQAQRVARKVGEVSLETLQRAPQTTNGFGFQPTKLGVSKLGVCVCACKRRSWLIANPIVKVKGSRLQRVMYCFGRFCKCSGECCCLSTSSFEGKVLLHLLIWSLLGNQRVSSCPAASIPKCAYLLLLRIRGRSWALSNWRATWVGRCGVACL